jgi:hypothetical protein
MPQTVEMWSQKLHALLLFPANVLLLEWTGWSQLPVYVDNLVELLIAKQNLLHSGVMQRHEKSSWRPPELVVVAAPHLFSVVLGVLL